MDGERWPSLAHEDWKDTYATLHMWSQIVGKIALALAPPVNHSWGTALQLTSRGLATQLLPHGGRVFSIEFDFVGHRLYYHIVGEPGTSLPLRSQTVASFYREVMRTLEELELHVKIWPVPVELPNPIPFELDTAHGEYDPEYTNRFWRILTLLEPLFKSARVPFIGKCSPVHFFWGSFDLAVTRFSGRRAPDREGPQFMREAYSHEVISHGFWPGSGPLLEPAFYAYAAPVPDGLSRAAVQPKAAFYHSELNEFILPYEAVRRSDDPAAAILAFIESTYEAAAELADWDRAALEAASTS